MEARGKERLLVKSSCLPGCFTRVSVQNPRCDMLCVWTREAQALYSRSRNPYAMETPAPAGIDITLEGLASLM